MRGEVGEECGAGVRDAVNIPATVGGGGGGERKKAVSFSFLQDFSLPSELEKTKLNLEDLPSAD